MESSFQIPVIRINDQSQTSAADLVAVEEPLEIRLAYGPENSRITQNISVTMRTPGNDTELALGFIFTEGIISGETIVENIGHVSINCPGNEKNIIQVSLAEGAMPNLRNTERNFYTTSSCGVCGKASINSIRTVVPFTSAALDMRPVSADILFGLPGKLSIHQQVFGDTGGLHAAALFNKNGEIEMVREDVGRHNALDKLIGASLIQKNVPIKDFILLLSGRASFELVQKAAMAGISIIAAVGAPSSLAVSLAQEFGITLVGFLRNKRFNIYSAAHRIKMQIHENTY
jgi:FdhD protein